MKTQAESDKEFNEWFSKSFDMHFKAAFAPLNKEIHDSFDGVIDDTNEALDNLAAEAAKAVKQIHHKLQVQERQLAKMTGQVRAMQREQDRLDEVVARQHEEILTLRIALGRNVKLLSLPSNRGRNDDAA